jgi:hypothetical protein
MNGKHWTDGELLEALYGVRPAGDHLSDCAMCGERWQMLVANRRALTIGVEADPAMLLRQRAAVMERIEHSRSPFVSWRAVTVLAGVTAMVIGFVLFQPARPKPVTVQTASSDSQFFSEIYSEMEQTEPRAMKPIRRLFQEKP